MYLPQIADHLHQQYEQWLVAAIVFYTSNRCSPACSLIDIVLYEQTAPCFAI
jgi:hypothetical protein